MQPSADFTEGSISGALLRFALPTLFSSVLMSLNASVNSIWVGHGLGAAAFTATANANTVILVLATASVGVAMATTILIGQAVGAKNLQKAKKVVGTSTSFFFLVSVLVAMTGLLFTKPLLAVMTTPPDSLALAESYLRVFFLGLPVMYGYGFAQGVFRGVGNATTPFYFMLLSVGLDIVLNPLLIFGVGWFPSMGIAGSALATVIANVVSLFPLIIYLYRTRSPVCLYSNEFVLLRPDWEIVGTLVVKGLPMSAQVLVMSLSGLLMMSLVNHFGLETSAAYGAALQLWNYIMMPALAISAAVSSMAAQNVGAGKWNRVHKIAGLGVALASVVTGAAVLLSEMAGPYAFRVFLPSDSSAVPIGSHINALATWSFMFFAASTVLLGVVGTTGAVVAPLVILIVTLLVVRFPLAGLFMERYHADAIWWSFPISSALSTVIVVLYYRNGGWRNAQMLKDDSGPIVSAALQVPTDAAKRP